MGLLKRLFGGGPEVRVDFSDRSDDELRALHRGREDLTEAARAVLSQEAARRGLSLDEAPEAPALDEAVLPEGVVTLPETPEVREALRLQREASRLYAHGDLMGMLAAGERALELLSAAMGEDHPALAPTLNLLAVARKELGDLDDAQKLLERSLSVAERALGGDRAALLPYLRNFGNFLRDRGQLEQSEAVLRRAVALGRATLGPDEPGLAYALEELVEVCRALGKTEEAEALQAEVERIYDQLEAEA